MINIIFSDTSGGVKTVSFNLSEALNKKGVRNNLYNMQDWHGGFLQRLFFTVRDLYNRKNETFILQHFDAIFLGLFLRLSGCFRLIYVVHTDLVAYYNSIGFIKKAIIKVLFFLVKNQKIVFVSKEAELKSRLFFNLSNTSTVYNIYQNNDIFNGEDKLAKNFTLGSISRLHTVKNIDLMIRLLKEINKKNKNVELLIYGVGEHSIYLSDYIHKLGCANFIKIMGASSDKKKMYDSIDALVSFSSMEGLPMIIIESISYGKPILHTDCSSGPRELISPESNPLIKTSCYEKTNVGYLVKPVFDVASYSDILTAYEEEYVGIIQSFISDVKAKKFSMKYDASAFSGNVVIEKWLKIIDKL